MNEADRVSRRHFLSVAGFTAAAVWLNLRLALAQETSAVTLIRESCATAKISIQKLRGNISMLEGSGGNIAVLTGRDGKLLVESGVAASRPRITEVLGSLSGDPVKHVVNTHWHFDHTDGNEWLHSIGAEITAHENTLKRLSTATRVDDWNFTFPASPKGALPTQLVAHEKTLRLNGTSVALKSYGPCHTDSDLSVHFTDDDVFCFGDTWWNGHYPFIDYSTGGSIDGTVRAAAENVARVSDKSLVIPGHGPVGSKAELMAFHDMLVAVREKVSRLKKDGRTLDEVIAAKPTAQYDAEWGGFVIKGNTFTALVYADV